MKKIIAITLGVAALACACNKEAAEIPVSSSPIRFSLGGEYSFTKATEAAFEDNDEIQIIAGAPVSAATKATVAGAALNLTTALYWGQGQTTSTDFVAIYPYTSSTETSFNYNLLYGGSHDFSYHKLYMTAKASSTPTDDAVVLPFKHPFSKVLVDITNQLGSDAVASVVFESVKMEGTMDLLAGTIDIASAEAVNAPAAKIDDNHFGIIVMPQTAQPRLVVTTTLGSVYTFTLPAAFTFEAGKVATAAITLAGQGGSGDAHGDALSFGFTVTDWAAAAENPIPNDPAVSMGNYWYAVGCLYDDDDTIDPWTVDFPMTYGGIVDEKEVWTLTINYDESMTDEEVSKGFKLRRYSSTTADENKWDTQYGMWASDPNTNMDIVYDYDLATAADGNKNIRFEAAGNYTLTLKGNNLVVVKN